MDGALAALLVKPRPHDKSGIKVTIKLRTKYRQIGKKRKCPNDQINDKLSTKCHQIVKPRPNDQIASQLSTNSHQSDHFDKLARNYPQTQFVANLSSICQNGHFDGNL